MAKTIEDKVDKVLEDLKRIDVLFLNKALEMNNLTPFDFFDFIEKEENTSKLRLFKRIENINNVYVEQKVTEQAFREGNLTKNGLLSDIIKAQNKEKFEKKANINHNLKFENFTDEQLLKEINKLKDKLD